MKMEYLEGYSEERNKAEALIQIANELETIRMFLCSNFNFDEDGALYISQNNK